eukprot:26261_6
MCMEKGTVLNKVFDRLKGALDVVNGIESIGGFAMSDDLRCGDLMPDQPRH